MVDRLRNALGLNDDDENRLPEHEYNDPNTVGAGIMSEGGTAAERGTPERAAADADAYEGGLDVDGDLAPERTYEGVDPTPADLFGGGVREHGDDVAGDDEGDRAVPPRTFRSL